VLRARVESPEARRSGRGWLNRNVVAISLADLLADANYEMTLAVLPLFLVIGLGASTVALGVVEGVGDACLAVAVFVSGLRSDRLPRRRWLATGGYATTVAGLAPLAVAGQWTQVAGSRAVAWVGRGVRKPIRSAMLAGSVERGDLGKAFGLHEALDTLGALIGPGIAFLLLATGHGFRTVFLAAVVPGVLSVLVFACLTRDPQTPSARPRPHRQAMPQAFWRLMAAVGTFGLGNFAVAFLILRALEMLRPELSTASATAAAVAFFLGINATGAVVAFPGGWLVDRAGGRSVLAAGYTLFAAACVMAAVGHGPAAVAVVAVAAGASAALVSLTEGSYVASIVDAEHRGTAFGIGSAVSGTGDLVSSIAVGSIWATAGPVPGLGYGAVLAVSAAVLLLVLRPRTPAASSA
jgi:MFS family permease